MNSGNGGSKFSPVEKVNIRVRFSLRRISDIDDVLAGEDDEKDLDDFPSDEEMILLLSSVLVQARPIHLMAAISYIDAFAWTVPVDMM